MAREALLAPIREWLVSQALGKADITEMFEQVCLRLLAIGVPVSRARLFWPTLHPLFQAETVLWDKNSSAFLEQFPHRDEATDGWRRSPLAFVVDNNIEVFRRQLQGPNETLDFEILKELKEEGYTDYLLLATELADVGQSRKEGTNNGILVTWASDRASGFSDEDLNSLQQIQRRFSVAAKTIIQSRISDNITSTYLGSRAGNSVLDGQIRLGDGARTKAVVWYSDLRNSTSHAETMEPDAYFQMLNAYFEATAGPVASEGGEILDFIGDAVLGIFPFENNREQKRAAKSAHAALSRGITIARELNGSRMEAGLQQFSFGIGLSMGDVMFGNIGIPQRLSFSVIGPTVNEVSRIEQLTKTTQHQILASGKLAREYPEYWDSIGLHKLDGLLEKVEVYRYVGNEA